MPPVSLGDADAWVKARARWLLLTERQDPPRPNQLTPGGVDWLIWLILAGRGFGKTRTGAEDVSDYARKNPGHRIAGVFDTFAAGRDVGVEGDSGILSVVPADCIENWNRSLGQLSFTNGARFDLYSAEKPGSLRGPQHHRAWVDELAKFRYLQETWDQLMFGLRLGSNPQCVITTTPKPLTLLRDILARPTTRITRGSTFDNAKNLSPAMLAELRLRYEGSRLGLQELYAEILDDYEGALWNRGMIDAYRLTSAVADPRELADSLGLVRIVVGIDPSTWDPALGEDPGTIGEGLETGIVVVGIDDQPQPHVYVLEDASVRLSAEGWARRAIGEYHRWGANTLVPEVNLGGMVLSVIRLTDPDVALHRSGGKVGVRAAQGKRARAEPVSALYEQGRAHHVGVFADLEAQMCGWDPTESWSPDRIDALVWAVTALEPWQSGQVGTSARQVTAARLPTS